MKKFVKKYYMKIIYFILITCIVIFTFSEVKLYNNLKDVFLYIVSGLSFYYINRVLILENMYRDIKWISENNIIFIASSGIQSNDYTFWNDAFIPMENSLRKNVDFDDKFLENFKEIKLEVAKIWVDKCIRESKSISKLDKSYHRIDTSIAERLKNLCEKTNKIYWIIKNA